MLARRNVVPTVGLLVPALLIAACSPRAIMHPVAAFLVRPGLPAFTLHSDKRSPSNRSDAISVLAKTVIAATVRWRADGPDAPTGEMRGLVPEAAVDHWGHIAVLDAQASAVRLFDSVGHQLQLVRGPGTAPDQFRQARAIAFGPRGELLVFHGLGTVFVYEPSHDSLRFVRSFAVRGDVFGGCVLGDRVYVHALRSGEPGAIRVYTLQGTSLFSFAGVYRSPNPIIAHQLSRGLVACISRSHTILLAPELLPEIRAYHADGRLLWWAKIDGFVPCDVIELPDGGSVLRTPPSGCDHSATLVAAGDRDQAVLQLARGSASGSGPASVRYETFTLDVAQRSATYLGPWFRKILAYDGRVAVVVAARQPAELTVLRTREE